MNRFLKICSAFLFIGCEISYNIDEQRINNIELELGGINTESPFQGEFTFFKNIPYGLNERNRLDILLPDQNKLEGVVIFFHGGAFLFGTKEDLYEGEQQKIISSILNENIAVVNAEYRFISDENSNGVISSLEDGAAVIDLIKQKSPFLDIPPGKIILAGISAGAGIAQWNGFREESNSQVKGILATIAQSTYDLYQWEELFPDFSLDSLRRTDNELDDLYNKFYGRESTFENDEILDYRNFMDANDPALYIYNPVYEDEIITSENTIDFNILFHSYKHADFLRKKAISVGLEYSGSYQESPIDFIKRKIKE
ncbi:MAG: alpha/beta hydrolase [Flavobacteriaceae bacterium]